MSAWSGVVDRTCPVDVVCYISLGVDSIATSDGARKGRRLWSAEGDASQGGEGEEGKLHFVVVVF